MLMLMLMSMIHINALDVDVGFDVDDIDGLSANDGVGRLETGAERPEK